MLQELINEIKKYNKIFIYGPSGTGKTPLAEEIYKVWNDEIQTSFNRKVGNIVFNEPSHIDQYVSSYIKKNTEVTLAFWDQYIITIDNIVDKDVARLIKPYMIDSPKKLIICSIVAPNAFKTVIANRINNMFIIKTSKDNIVIENKEQKE